MNINETISDIESCDDVAALMGKLQSIAGDYGFISFNFLDIGHPNKDVPFYLTTVSKEFEAAYRDNSFISVDP
jgi:hypothetical protein